MTRQSKKKRDLQEIMKEADHFRQIIKRAYDVGVINGMEKTQIEEEIDEFKQKFTEWTNESYDAFWKNEIDQSTLEDWVSRPKLFLHGLQLEYLKLMGGDKDKWMQDSSLQFLLTLFKPETLQHV